MGKRSRSKVTGAQYGLSVTSATVVTLTVPAAAMVASIYVRTAAVVFTRDGTDPTATAGVQADPKALILLTSRDEVDKFKVIAVSATATLDVEYFTDVGGLPEVIKSQMRVEGIAAEDTAASGNPVLVGAQYETTDRALEAGDVGAVAGDVAGRIKVVGPAAHDAAAVGNPVRMGGVYRTALPAIAAGDIGDIFVNADGRIQLAHPGAVTLNKDVTADDSDKTVTVTTGEEWKILGIMINFTSTTTAGTRSLRLIVGDGSNSLLISKGMTLPASRVVTLHWLPGAGSGELPVFSADEKTIIAGLPNPFWLKAGYTIRLQDQQSIDAAADDMEAYILYMARDAA